MAALPDLRSLDRRRLFLIAVFAVAATMSCVRLLREVTDFGITLDAARMLIGGGTGYEPQAGREQFLWYPHWVLLPVIGLDAILSETSLRIVHGLGLGAATVLLARDLETLARPAIALRAWHVVVFVLLFGRCFTNNYTHGQLTLWTAVLIHRGLVVLARRGPAWRTGAALGAAAAMKLTPGLFGPLLLVLGRWREALAAGVAAALLVLVVPLPFLGPELHVTALAGFWEVTLAPLFGQAEPREELFAARSASIPGTLEHLFGPPPQPAADGARPFHVTELGPTALTLLQAGWSALVVALGIAALWRVRRRPAAAAVAVQGAVTTLWMALFSPQTKPYHLLMAGIAALLFAGTAPGRDGRAGRWLAWGTVAALLAISMPLRQKGLVGRELWRTLDQAGLLHLGIVGMLAWTAMIAGEVGGAAATGSAGPREAGSSSAEAGRPEAAR